jgi:hypothetical protein
MLPQQGSGQPASWTLDALKLANSQAESRSANFNRNESGVVPPPAAMPE